MENPGKSEWAKLHNAANEFNRVSPWAWMENEELFAVVDPQTGETGFCSILGNGGQEFGLGIFMGAQGYRRYLGLMSDELEAESLDASIMTPALTLLFADRRDLQKEDIEVIRSLGLQYHGRNAWPLFRSQKPGYAPWFLEKAEAVYLTSALEQALVVAGRVKNKTLDLYEETDDDLVFTRYYNDGKWQEEWRKPELGSEEQPADSAALEAELTSFRDSGGPLNGSWELDIFIMPIPIGPKSARPYFPLCLLAVERQYGIVIGNKMEVPWLTQLQKRQAIILLLREAKQIPQSIRVKSKQVKELLEPIASGLGIKLQVGKTTALNKFKASLNEYLSGKTR